MASVVLLAALVMCVSFPARAQDVRRQYVAGCGSFSPPGFERQLADMKEETDRLKNQMELMSLVQTSLVQQSDIMSRLSSLGDRIEQQKTSLQTQIDSLSNQLSEERVRSAKLESQVQNLTTTLYEHDINIKQRLQCSCERLVPGGVIPTTAATLPREPVFTSVNQLTNMTSSMEPQTDTPTERPAAEVTTTQPSIPPPATESMDAGTGTQIRLAGGSTRLEGRVEVRNGTGQWGSVCDDNFDLQDAGVVCRQLGIGAAVEVKLEGHFGEGSGNVWLDEVACRGNETDLGDCPADSWGRSDCSHKEDVGVVCAGEAALRLVGSPVPWKGRLQVRPWRALEWGAVCNTSWTEAEAGFVCRQMGCTGGMTSSGQVDIEEGSENIWLGDVTCSGDETNILSCDFSWEPSDCDHSQDVHVICTVDGGWSNWGAWSGCSVTCGVGIETRDRTCTNPAPANGGVDCVGQAQETQHCDTGVSCSIDGGWSNWGAWSGCSVTCGSGTETRDRTCTNPAPANGGADCVGQAQESQQCDTGVSCPVINGGWSNWGAWSGCSVNCGSGTETRDRTCTNPAPANGGADCVGQTEDIRQCHTGVSCSISGTGGTWTEYNFAFEDNWNACHGKKYVKLSGFPVGRYVGVVLCSAVRYKIFLSDDLHGMFLNVADGSGHGQDHCEFLGVQSDTTAIDNDFWGNPSIVGYYRHHRREVPRRTTIGFPGKYYPHWYECGVSIP